MEQMYAGGLLTTPLCLYSNLNIGQGLLDDVVRPRLYDLQKVKYADKERGEAFVLGAHDIVEPLPG